MGKLTDRDALAIRYLVLMGHSQSELARGFGVGKAYINNIIKMEAFRNVRWSHI